MVAALTQDQIDFLDGNGRPSPFGVLAAALLFGTSYAAVLAHTAESLTETDAAVGVTKRVTTTDGVASGTARVVGGMAKADPVASTAITGTTETEANFDRTYTLPAGSLKVGTVVRIRATGIHTAASGTETHVLLVKLGTVTLAATGNIDPAANDVFSIEFEFVVRAIGATGTVVGDGVVRSGPRATASPATHMLATGAAAVSTITVDTTVANVIAIAIDRQAAATDADSARLDRICVEIIG